MRGRAGGFLRRDFAADWSSRFSLLLQALNVGLSVVAYFFLSRLVGEEALDRWASAGEGYFPFALIGTALNGAMFTAMTGLTRSLQHQQPSGVLKPLLFGRSRPEAVVLLSSLYPLTRAAVELVAYLLVGWAMFGPPLGGANLFGAALVASLGLVAFAGLGLFAAALTVFFRCGNPLLWVLASASWLLGGVLYPPSMLPAPLRWAGRCFPLTSALEGLRAAILEGASLADLLPPIAFLAAFSALAIPLGLALFRVGLTTARVRGTLAAW